MLSLRKTYLDSVSRNSEVRLRYACEFEFAGMSGFSGGLEHYGVLGRRTVSSVANAEFKIGAEKALWISPGDRAQWLIKSGAWEPAWGLEGLRWRVLAARMDGVGGSRGYADEVLLTRSPRLLGLKRLIWGRIHGKQRTTVFCRVELKRGKPLQALICAGKKSLEHSVLNLEQGNGFSRLSSPLLGPKGLVLKHHRVLHEGPALDSFRLPGIWERAFWKLWAGDLSETRILSRADGGWALHEVVDFL